MRGRLVRKFMKRDENGSRVETALLLNFLVIQVEFLGTRGGTSKRADNRGNGGASKTREREFRVIGDKTWHRRNFYFPSFALIDNKAQPFLLFLSSNTDFHRQRGLNQVSN